MNVRSVYPDALVSLSGDELEELIAKVQKQMKTAAADLNFEMAAAAA